MPLSSCDSISTDSLESPNSNINSTIPFYKGEVPTKFAQHLKANMNKHSQRNLTKKSTGPTYPELRIKHYHNNKLTNEKVIPAVDGSRKKKNPTYVEVYQQGDVKGKLSINQKSYLGMFKAKNGCTGKGDSDKSTLGDNSPRVLDDGDCYHDDFEDSSSFYLNLIENIDRKPSHLRFPSQVSTDASIISEDSKSSSMIAAGLRSISTEMISSETTPKLTKRISQVPPKNLIRLGSLGPDLQATKIKMDRFLKQREYGQSVSNMNRHKILQNKLNRDAKPAKETKSSKLKSPERQDDLSQKLDAPIKPDKIETKRIFSGYRPRSSRKPTLRRNDLVEIYQQSKLKSIDSDEITLKNQPLQNPIPKISPPKVEESNECKKSLEKFKTKVGMKPVAMKQRMLQSSSKICQKRPKPMSYSIQRVPNLSMLQERHLKEKELVEKLIK